MGKGQHWLLQRVALALDVHVRAQGSNGGFRLGIPNNWVDDDGVWVGGPHRMDALNPLEGWGHTSIARTFILTADAFASSGLLDEQIDDDDDPMTPNVTRRNAYAQLFNMSRYYLSESKGVTYCPNQNLGDAKGAFCANRALELLNTATFAAWSDEEMLDRVVRPAIGLVNFSQAMWVAKTGGKVPLPAGEWVTISPAGISLEAIGSMSGGYSSGYSDILGKLDDWAVWALEWNRTATYAALVEVLDRMATSFAFYRFLDNCQKEGDASGGPFRCLRNDGFTTWRNNANPGPPLFQTAPHVALVLKNQIYIRELQLYMQNFAGAVGQFYNAMPTRQIAVLSQLAALQAMPPTVTRLPHEDEHPPFAWADNVGRSVVAKACGSRIFVAFQWRHDTPWPDSLPEKGLTPNGICRVHLLEDNGKVERLATVSCPSTSLLGVQSLGFGRFAIGMNSNLYLPQRWAVPKEYVGTNATDLVSGQHHVSVMSSLLLLPNQSIVLYSDDTNDPLDGTAEVLAHEEIYRI